MKKFEYLTKHNHVGKNVFIQRRVKLQYILCLFVAAISCSLFLCGCGAKAAEDEIVMKLSENGISETTAWNDTEKNETTQQTDKDMTTVSEISATSEDSSQSLYIYICGAVENPGVYELEVGSRLYEAVEQAGGFTEAADVTCLNLARQVIDGEQVVILTKEQIAELEEAGKYTLGQTSTLSANSTIAVSNTTVASTQESGLVNINTATVSELTAVSGIGESRAQAIVAYREKNGNFRSIEDIKKVDGIKDGIFSKIKDKITI